MVFRIRCDHARFLPAPISTQLGRGVRAEAEEGWVCLAYFHPVNRILDGQVGPFVVYCGPIAAAGIALA